ncbi:MAG: lipoprotein [Gammaproteobacteria bacterium]|nr:lipoprotein [Gammaproteobacteria bacterium]
MKIRFTGLLLLISLFLLSACGQKGPLYLEKPTAPEAKANKLDKEAVTEKVESDVKSVKPGHKN